MQELKQEVEGDIQSTKYTLPEGYTGTNIHIADDYKNEMVVLKIDDLQISIPLAGARDLSLALRQSVNRIEKRMMMKGTFHGYDRRKKY